MRGRAGENCPGLRAHLFGTTHWYDLGQMRDLNSAVRMCVADCQIEKTHMNKLVHAIVLVLFGAACGFVALMLKLPGLAVRGGALPAFTRLCMGLGPYVLLALGLAALAYCVWVWAGKTEPRGSWVGFLSTAFAALSLVLLPTIVAIYLPLADVLNRMASR